MFSTRIPIGAFVILLNTIVCPLIVNAVETETSLRAEYDTTQVLQQLLLANERIKAFHVVYESVAENTAEPGITIRREIFAHPPSSLLISFSKATSLYDFQHDPFRRRLFLRGNQGVDEATSDRAFARFTVSPDDTLPEIYASDIFFLAFAWWPLLAISPPTPDPKAKVVIPAIAASRQYVVRSKQEMVNGHQCHVLVYDGRDSIWLDMNRGCLIIAREITDQHSQRVIQRIETTDCREVAPHIWAPIQFKNILYDSNQSGTVAMDTTFQIRRISVNAPIAKNVFAFQPMPGAIEVSPDDRFEQIVPGGFDHLEELLEQAKLYSGMNDSLSRQHVPSRATVVMNIVSTLSMIAIVILVRRSNRPKPPALS